MAGSKNTKKRSKKKETSGASLSELQTIHDKSKEEHHHAQNTNKIYRRYRSNGDKFLKTLVESMRAGLAGPTSIRTVGDEDEATIDIDEFAKAFDKPPNRYSVQALEAFLVQKCIVEGLGVGTRDGVHAAFKRYWDEM